jgi:hypothetical protein
MEGRPFVLSDAMGRILSAGIMQPSLIKNEVDGEAAR